MNARSGSPVFLAALYLSIVSVTACASSGGGRSTASEASTSPPRTMSEMYEAGDLAGTVRAFLADSTLAGDESAVFRAAIASAMPGHSESDNIRALDLFTRLLVEFPESRHRTTARLVLGMLEEEAALRRSNGSLERELEQLKAIDLGERP
ncbi:MAG: hypothetical protein ACE5FP_03235 [Gemmatimonadota bacterium]